jgi:hypothetical protein
MAIQVRTLKLKNLPWVFAFFTGVPLLIRLVSGGRDLYDAFLEDSINARVAVRGYNHANPMITILNGVDRGKKTGLMLFPAASYYLRTNDSIIKKAGANTLTIIRDSADYRIITHWTNNRESDSVEKEVIKK